MALNRINIFRSGLRLRFDINKDRPSKVIRIRFSLKRNTSGSTIRLDASQCPSRIHNGRDDIVQKVSCWENEVE